MDWLIHALDLHLFQPQDLLIVLVLVILEGLLSCDNAVVLALLVKDLPPEQRGKALRYGIIGAYVFRILALCLAVWVISIWWIKVLGGAYLCWLAIEHFRRHGGGEGEQKPRQVRLIAGLGAFWSTVVWVELTDIVFSIDSIAAAVALSKHLWVLILGGLLGILAMRFAAQGFVKLLELFPRLETCAFVAVAIIGLKLLLEFPVDVVGRAQALPPDAAYSSAEEYRAVVDRHVPPAYAIPHVLTINLVAPEAPQRARFAAGEAGDKEYAAAEAEWALHRRPFIEVEGWASSLLVLAVFAAGFLRRRRPPAAG
ncbi:MAG: hypothetical protein RMM29_08700 [Planctomycetota bacterium]|nr:hypothetical protein [Planctomycetota bacterium]MCX8039112.1 hypothetical protein [Planctomycetota bacterium]MDW8373706.1 hypothetical protein [Planctomycetota bacterium]